ncbi:MAG TPA: 3-deoxy-8-phosphooctulonate synthase [candidate division Zixibacteria bacterium]|nr:3-deoxy-8-phosphooctulonate synthase [candidate division Zixibacteria bacterium]MDD4917438.1 3-deoxy-8-phosphooctulonate synthase [candidate division Zixibacteria bacterium]MDM7972996.1 3-deoxy-8-phosphooctulonate synthase [candidate division Zixibacteria bacterium]HOD67284.1 3-deoxy-8-phosphooctulonate synthase [candidate division Zixibacteria bacterium]HPM36632.1 3-deoxy-8-phosphooctulonate synthase [candidate division Zixibacteria bacterium]
MIEAALSRVAAGEFFLIAGPCVVESHALCLEIAERVAELCARRRVPYIFKASFKKANRTAPGSYTGPGIAEGLAALAAVRERMKLPVLTDVHETSEVAAVAAVVDILQIPAFLSRQTDLLAAAGATGKWVNIKKGQFLAPDDMAYAVQKTGSDKVMLTERGTTFGYHNLVVDFRSLLIMREYGRTVFDATHSLQLPSAASGVSGGRPDMVIPMAKAAVAIGVNGLFVETHPDPARARSDAGAMLPLDRIPDLLDQVLRIRNAAG